MPRQGLGPSQPNAALPRSTAPLFSCSVLFAGNP